MCIPNGIQQGSRLSIPPDSLFKNIFFIFIFDGSSPFPFPEERDEYDEEFDRMREANLKTRQVQAKEEYSDAVKNVDKCRKNLATAREQV